MIHETLNANISNLKSYQQLIGTITMQFLGGTLQFVGRPLSPGRAFLRRIGGTASGIRQPHHHNKRVTN